MPAAIVVRHHTTTVGFWSALTSGLFGLANIVIIAGYAIGAIPLWFVQVAAWWWAVVCVGYLSTQLGPMATALIASEVAFRIDRWTSWFPVVATIGAAVYYLSSDRAGAVGMVVIVVGSLLTSVFDIVLGHLTRRLRTGFLWAARRIDQLEEELRTHGHAVPPPP